jgi:hypothetical protein
VGVARGDGGLQQLQEPARGLGRLDVPGLRLAELEQRPPTALPQRPVLLDVDGAGVDGELEEALEADGQVGDDVGRAAVGVGGDGDLTQRLEADLDALGVALAIGGQPAQVASVPCAAWFLSSPRRVQSTSPGATSTTRRRARRDWPRGMSSPVPRIRPRGGLG